MNPTPIADVGAEAASAGAELAAASAEVEVEPAPASVDGDEPESRLMLETAATDAPEPADYLPLFMAPQPIRVEYDARRRR